MDERRILPEYPSIPHLPWKPNTTRADRVATLAESSIIFIAAAVSVQEKCDGASVGIAWVDGHPLVRNSNHILRKGFTGKKTPAKQQFSSIWGWIYDHRYCFEKLPDTVVVYGDWMIQQHGLEYDLLPDWLLTYDLYDYSVGRFLPPVEACNLLATAGFRVVPELHYGAIENYDQLEAFCNEPSPYTTKGHREGVCVKIADKDIVHRFKMVRSNFRQGSLWSESELKRNSLRE